MFLDNIFSTEQATEMGIVWVITTAWTASMESQIRRYVRRF